MGNILKTSNSNSRSTGASALFWLFILVLMLINIDSVLCSNSTCIRSERDALLKLKQDLRDPSNRLASWAADNEDCCSWAGVICDGVTGHVRKLFLGVPIDVESDSYMWTMEEYNRLVFGGTINPSLLDLTHLHHLDLSNNDFGGIRIPEFFGSLHSLRYLNLSDAGFGGEIPHQLGNLTKLIYLDLRGLWYIGTMHSKSLQWLSGFTSLQYLDMSQVNLSEANDWLQVINTLPSLLVLRLSYCGLSENNISPAYNHVNFSSLVVLDLSSNYMHHIPTWVFKLRSLSSLYFRQNALSGSIPEAIQNLTYLMNLDLSYNYFNASIPSWLFGLSRLEVLNLRGTDLRGTISPEIKNLTSMTVLDLSYNYLEGKVPVEIGELCELRKLSLSRLTCNQEISQVLDSLSRCVSNKLELVDFRSGKFYGRLTDQIAQLKRLKYLDLSFNSISGPIPALLGTLSDLQELYISYNHFNGTLPESFGQLVNLQYLDISENVLDGIVSEAHFANATRLKIFQASRTPLTLRVCPCWVPPFQLYSLDLSSWVLGQQFPSWIQSQKKLSYLDMSNTKLSGFVPSWFWNFSSQFTYLDLSHNQFIGRIPHMSGITGYQVLDLSSNYFEGPLESILPNLYALDVSNNLLQGSISKFLCHNLSEIMDLEVLNLEKNQLTGEIPNCWTKWRNLKIIKLSNNSFMGNIPSSMGSLILLRSLHMRDNQLSGEMPVFLQNLTRLIVLDLSENNLQGIIPPWVGRNLSELQILSIRSNELCGRITDELCALKFLQIVDLASNNLSGPIPRCFNSFFTMAVNSNFKLYYLENTTNFAIEEEELLVTKGKLFQYNTLLPLVTIIDLSCNFLSGPIPEEITSLSSLWSLNLSNNLLTGEIPSNIGNMRALESLDLSTNRLSGEIPTSMSSLNFLSHLNLSFNNLRGKIPTGTQLQIMDVSGFIGNSLCGPPLPQNCGSKTSLGSQDTQIVRGKGLQVDWFYVSMGLGFVVGFWGFLGPLFLNRSWRYVYFQFLEDKWEKLSELCQ